MGSKQAKEIALLLTGVALIVIGVFVGIWFADRSANPEYIVAPSNGDTVFILPATTPRPTFTPPVFTPIPTTNVLGVITPTFAALQTSSPAPVGTVIIVTPPQQVMFEVVVDEIYFQSGPGTAYPPIAIARRGAVLPAVARTANGLWWQVCCLDGGPVWMALDGKTVLKSGDANAVAISEVAVIDATPIPAPAIAVAPPTDTLAIDDTLVVAAAAPTPTLEPGNPACATGASYDTIPPVGEPDRRPAATNPEINLAIRSYAPFDGFRQMVGIGGETDVHAPQLNTLFADKRITQDFPTVYKVHEWDYNCNCRSNLTSFPEVTALGVSTRNSETLYTPARTQGDIGGGYLAMVLYASPTSLTLKYTREDNMLSGYGVHLDGICVDPNLLNLYRTLDAQGRTVLPVLGDGDAIGLATGGELRIAVRDTGQFMDPRSQKDWWVGN